MFFINQYFVIKTSVFGCFVVATKFVSVVLNLLKKIPRKIVEYLWIINFWLVIYFFHKYYDRVLLGKKLLFNYPLNCYLNYSSRKKHKKSKQHGKLLLHSVCNYKTFWWWTLLTISSVIFIPFNWCCCKKIEFIPFIIVKLCIF